MHHNLAARQVYMASLSAMLDTASIKQLPAMKASTIQSTRTAEPTNRESH
jgi:hypothetical protein